MMTIIRYPMEVHVEPPPPGGPPDAPGANFKQTFANPDQYMQPQQHVPASQPIVPIPKHPHFPIPQVTRPPSPRNAPLTRSTGAHPDDRRPKAKLRFPEVTGIQPPPVRVVSKPKAKAEPVVIQPLAPVALPGQGLKEQGPPIDPDIEAVNEPGSSSAGPPAIPGLPVTEGEFPIVPQSPAPRDAVPIPESGSESDSDRTVDYRDDPATLLALVESSDDVLLQLPDDFYVPDFVPLDGDGFASWLTRHLQACPRAEFVLGSTFCTQYKITKRLGLYLENLSSATMDFVLGRRQSFMVEGLAADGACTVQNQYTGFVKQKNLD